MGPKVSKTYIENEIDNFILQQQRALVNVVTQSIINVSHRIVQEQSANIISNASASNILNGYSIVVKNNAKFSIVQQNYLKSNAEAILNLIQDNTLILKLSNNIKNDVMSSLSQNADVANKLKAAASIAKERSNSGEVNAAISAVGDVASGVIGAFEPTEDKNTIINNVSQHYAMFQESETNLSNLINNTINQNINQKTISNCLNNSILSNVINLKRIVIDGQNSSFQLTQKNMLDSFYRCVISSTIKSRDLQQLSNDIVNTSSQELGQAAVAANDLSATTSDIDKNISKSWLDSLTSQFGIIIITVVIAVIVLLVYKLSASSNKGQQLPYNQSYIEGKADAFRRDNAKLGSDMYKSSYNQAMLSKPPPYDAA
jgi:hypothetical protein